MLKNCLYLIFLLSSFMAYSQEDCDCEIGPDDIPVCVEIEEGFVVPFPNECFAACFGYTAEDYVDCDEIPPFPQDTTYVDCDCEISEKDELVCVLTNSETGEVCPFPNLCFAECFGYTAEDVVDCGDFDWDYEGEWPQDSTWIDSTYVDPCGCDWDFDPELEWICVMGEDGFSIPYPTLCFAECDGFTEADVVACDFGDWPQDSTYVDPCGCDWDFDPELEWICVMDADGFSIPYPTLCFAECDGFTEADVVACDFGDWPQDSTYVDPCGCDWDFDPELEWICVMDADGFSIPYPTLCFAECDGFTEADVVACDFGDWPQDSTWIDCDCEILPEDEPVCVDLGGEVCELPNQCFADCLGLDTVDCNGFEGEVGSWTLQQQYAVEDEETFIERTKAPKVVLDPIYPNPVSTQNLNLVIDLEGSSNMNAEITLTDIYGNVLTRSSLMLSKGKNNADLSLNNVNKGIFFVNIITENGAQSQRLIKQ